MKRILTVLLALMMLLSLASCEKSATDDTSRDASESEVEKKDESKNEESKSEESKSEESKNEENTDNTALVGAWLGDWDCTAMMNSEMEAAGLEISFEGLAVAMRFEFAANGTARLYTTEEAAGTFADEVVGQMAVGMKPILEEAAAEVGVTLNEFCVEGFGMDFDEYIQSLRNDIGLEVMFPTEEAAETGRYALINGNKLYTFGFDETWEDADGYLEITLTDDTLTLEKFVGDESPFTFPIVMKKQ